MQRLRNFMRNDQPSTKTVQRPQSYRGACTHVRASRMFNEQVLCSHCGQPGNMGWVYRCTQDSDGRVPIDESGLDEFELVRLKEHASRNGWRLPGIDPTFTERMFRMESNYGDITSLKPWMRKAAAVGGYTPLQIEKLIAQRMQVKQMIWAEEMSIGSNEDGKPVSQAKQKTRLKSKAGEKTVMHTTGLDGQEIELSKGSGETNKTENGTGLSFETYRKSSLCDYKCCATCRPIMRDRAWMAIDSVIHPEDPDMFPDDVDVRPMAAANIILGIGSHSDGTQPTTSTSSMDLESSEEFGSAESDDLVSRRRSASFLDNVRQVYSDYMVNPNPHSKSANSGSLPGSQQSSYSEIEIVGADEDERTAALSVDRPESRIGESWMGNDISNGHTPMLPLGFLQHMRQDSIDNLLASAASHSTLSIPPVQAGGELHVGEGVAVTEEAVDFGLADIITQS